MRFFELENGARFTWRVAIGTWEKSYSNEAKLVGENTYISWMTEGYAAMKVEKVVDGGPVFKSVAKHALAVTETGKSPDDYLKVFYQVYPKVAKVHQTLKDVCRCPMQRGGGINHHDECKDR